VGLLCFTLFIGCATSTNAQATLMHLFSHVC
jgi:hypothetical protein